MPLDKFLSSSSVRNCGTDFDQINRLMIDKVTRPANVTTDNLVSIKDTSGEIKDSGISAEQLVLFAESGGIDMRGNLVSNVGEPKMYADVTTKSYVDNMVNDIVKSLIDYVTEVTINKNGDAMLGNLDMNDHIISNLGNPNSDNDACTKSYADTLVLETKTYSDQNFLKLDGSSGDLDMGGHVISNLSTPNLDNDACTKLYTDILSLANKTYTDETFLKKQDDTMTGYLDMNSFPLLNLPPPVSGSDPATKDYVDKKEKHAYITVYAQKLTENTGIETAWSFGGNIKEYRNFSGYVSLFNGRIKCMGISSAAVDGISITKACTVNITIDGTEQGNYFVSKDSGNKAVRQFSPPLEISTGDVINFISKDAHSVFPDPMHPERIDPAIITTVSLIIELDIA